MTVKPFLYFDALPSWPPCQLRLQCVRVILSKGQAAAAAAAEEEEEEERRGKKKKKD